MSKPQIHDPASLDALQRVIEYSREEATRLGLEAVCYLLDMAKRAVEEAADDPHHLMLYGVNEALMRQH